MSGRGSSFDLAQAFSQTLIDKWAATRDETATAHVVRVENLGSDWFLVSYRIADLMPRYRPRVEGWAVVGNDIVLGWFRAEGRTWFQLCDVKDKVPPT